VTFLVSLAIVLQATTAAASHAALATDVPHPAVVRVIAPEADGVAYGSGTLVGTRGQQGLVVTNWHVVRDAQGQIEVVFPDGFRSAATVLATDADWDLAALAIWRPAIEPVRLAVDAPRPGEPLTIAGYGSGGYRAVTGRCTQYVAPATDLPFEMVELSVAARQGDSGGPILNGRGELAGVLFGAARGTTTGSYCGRVRWFLARVTDQFRQLPDASSMLAVEPPAGQLSAPRPEPSPPPVAAQWPTSEPRDSERWQPTPAEPIIRPREARPMTAAIPATPHFGEESPLPAAEDRVGSDGWIASTPGGETDAAVSESPNPAIQASDGPNRLDQIKTVLAVIGGLAVLFHGLRLFRLMKG
jgi:hypothetical protein